MTPVVVEASVIRYAVEIAGLREMAEWIETNRETLNELGFSVGEKTLRGSMCVSDEEGFARALDILGDVVRVEMPKGTDTLLRVYRDFGPFEVYAFIRADIVAEKVRRTVEVEEFEWTLKAPVTS